MSSISFYETFSTAPFPKITTGFKNKLVQLTKTIFQETNDVFQNMTALDHSNKSLNHSSQLQKEIQQVYNQTLDYHNTLIKNHIVSLTDYKLHQYAEMLKTCLDETSTLWKQVPTTYTNHHTSLFSEQVDRIGVIFETVLNLIETKNKPRALETIGFRIDQIALTILVYKSKHKTNFSRQDQFCSNICLKFIENVSDLINELKNTIIEVPV